MSARTLITVPAARRGEIVEVRTMISHPMETGHRPDSAGKLVPRNIVTRFECRFEGRTIFAADLYPAVAANPYLAFALRAERSGTLQFSWSGDNGFMHTESRPLSVT